jgi:hypothetical protein
LKSLFAIFFFLRRLFWVFPYRTIVCVPEKHTLLFWRNKRSLVTHFLFFL